MQRFDDRDADSSWLAALRPFPDQSRGRHLLVAAVGVAGWSAAFLAALAALGGAGVATAEAAADIRLLAGVVASVGVGAYFGAAVGREWGGPVLNVLYAPLSAAVGATGLPLYAAYGAAPETAFAAPAWAARAWGGWSGVGEVLVFSTAGAVALAVVGVHLAFVVGPETRARIEAGFAPLIVVPAEPPSPEDLSTASGDARPGDDGGRGGAAGEAGDD